MKIFPSSDGDCRYLAVSASAVGGARILLVLEPRSSTSSTMHMGVHRDTLAVSSAGAGLVWLHEGE